MKKAIVTGLLSLCVFASLSHAGIGKSKYGLNEFEVVTFASGKGVEILDLYEGKILSDYRYAERQDFSESHLMRIVERAKEAEPEFGDKLKKSVESVLNLLRKDTAVIATIVPENDDASFPPLPRRAKISTQVVVDLATLLPDESLQRFLKNPLYPLSFVIRNGNFENALVVDGLSDRLSAVGREAMILHLALKRMVSAKVMSGAGIRRMTAMLLAEGISIDPLKKAIPLLGF